MKIAVKPLQMETKLIFKAYRKFAIALSNYGTIVDHLRSTYRLATIVRNDPAFHGYL